MPGDDEIHPAGTYNVQTDEEPIEGLSFLVYHRVATVIFLPLQYGGSKSFQAIPVTPEALETAQARDAREVLDGMAGPSHKGPESVPGRGTYPLH
ncbi:MAG: hypothetical protein ABWY78_14920 [Microvirga sp.]